MPNDAKHTDRFPGFSSPNYTQVPDELFDQLLPRLSGAELKVLLYVIRRTFGFKRESDNISLSQMLHGLRSRDGRVLDHGVGLSKKTLLQAIKSLEEQNVIQTERRRSLEKGDEPTTYRLNVLGSRTARETTPPVGEKLHQGGGGGTTPGPWGRNSPTQYTDVGQRESFSKLDGSDDLEDNPTRRPEYGGASSHGAITRSDYLHEEPTQPARAASDLFPLGEIISRRQQGRATPDAFPAHRPAPSAAARPRPGRPSYGSTEEREKIYAYLRDFAPELGDEANLSSSITQILKIFHAANTPIEHWDDHLYRSRAVTQEHTGSITKQASADNRMRRKNKFPYFKAVLVDLVSPRPAEPGRSDRSEQAG